MQKMNFLITTAAFVVVVAGMRAAESILIPFLLSVFIAVICAPSVFWLRRKGVPATLSVLTVTLAILGLEVALVTLIGTSINDFSSNLPFYQKRLTEETTNIVALLNKFGIEFSAQSLLSYVDPSAAMRLTARVLASLGSVLTNTFFIILTMIFILLEASTIPDKLKMAFDHVDDSKLHDFTASLNRYMAIKTAVSFGTGVAVTLLLKVIGVDYPILWGILAFLLNFVPNIGSIIAAIPPVLLGFIQFGPTKMLIIAIGFTVINVVVGNIIEPRYMGRGLGLSTLIVFLSLVFWGWVFGPIGMLLSVPLTMTLKIALESRDDTRWMAILLGPAPPAQVAATAASEKPSK
jgi:predicted PurR-regulated permease PerM